MRRFFASLVIVVLVISGTIALTAPKTYQFTGTVKAADKDTFVVEKSATETWTFSYDASLKTPPKVGDKVTVFYKMMATSVETKK